MTSDSWHFPHLQHFIHSPAHTDLTESAVLPIGRVNGRKAAVLERRTIKVMGSEDIRSPSAEGGKFCGAPGPLPIRRILGFRGALEACDWSTG